MNLKPVATWVWDEKSKRPMRCIEKHLAMKGLATDKLYEQLLAALDKGKAAPPPEPERWALKADISIDYNAVTEEYISYFWTHDEADTFWKDWRVIEQQLGVGDKLLNCNGTSHENGSGGA